MLFINILYMTLVPQPAPRELTDNKFQTLKDVTSFYSDNSFSFKEKHKFIYDTFKANLSSIETTIRANKCQGYGEAPFFWSWYLLIKEMSSNFSFLEIGVYKGKVMASVQLIAMSLNKQCNIVGISPLADVGDKYSKYNSSDFLSDIQTGYANSGITFDNTKIIKEYSQNLAALNESKDYGPYDIVYIDGCHDYDVVCQDIDNYLPLLKPTGFLVMDDASSLIQDPYGVFVGHADVARAVKDKLDNNNEVQHLFAIGHNRVWRKK